MSEQRIISEATPVRIGLVILFFVLAVSVSAQNTPNVTNYGAVGDAIQFYANTVSNSINNIWLAGRQ